MIREISSEFRIGRFMAFGFVVAWNEGQPVSNQCVLSSE